MKILIVLAHPEPKSFTGAMYRSAIETLTNMGHEVKHRTYIEWVTIRFLTDVILRQ